jgi:hypothetical protein
MSYALMYLLPANPLDTTIQCGGSGMFIPDPGSRIPNQKTATKERGETKFVVITFYVATKFHKIANYFSFEVLHC